MKVCDSNSAMKTATLNKNDSHFLVKMIFRFFENCTAALEIELPKNECLVIGQGEVVASLRLHSWKPLYRWVFGGHNAWAKSYIDGQWSCDDLTAVICWGASQEKHFKLMRSVSVLSELLDNFYHWRRNNSRKGSKENIAAHYDLGNGFYKHWLDETMSYSSALFEYKGQSLVDAQINKNNKILELLASKPDDRVLEIGCGWGGFAEQAFLNKSVSVSGITLSEEQLAWANERVKNDFLADGLSFSLKDYRDVDKEYDSIVSIEMFEAVGESHWDEYFRTVRKVLKEDGVAVLQIITIDDDRFWQYRKSADFIQRYVFPGGMLPSVEILHNKFKEHGFSLEQEVFFGEDYATTLAHWRSEFDQHWDKLEALGFDQQFKRLWHYYLSYCEGGFLEKTIDVGMFKIRKI